MNAPIDLRDVVLHTPRLTLRPWRLSDLDDFHAYAREDGVGQKAGWLPHKTGRKPGRSWTFSLASTRRLPWNTRAA